MWDKWVDWENEKKLIHSCYLLNNENYLIIFSFEYKGFLTIEIFPLYLQKIKYIALKLHHLTKLLLIMFDKSILPVNVQQPHVIIIS